MATFPKSRLVQKVDECAYCRLLAVGRSGAVQARLVRHLVHEHQGTVGLIDQFAIRDDCGAEYGNHLSIFHDEK